MNSEILINVTSGEARVAVLDNGVLQEVFVERTGREGLVGNIYQGRVVRVLPGMQAAFIDIGLDRTAFLHVSDFQHAAVGQPEPDIRKLLREGDEYALQIVKEPMGSKGARLSAFISIPSRYVVLLPRRPGVGISARIEDEQQRERLTAIADDWSRSSQHGCILRTVAEGADEAAVRADLRFVTGLWEAIEKKQARQSGVQLLHSDLPLAVRVLRDMAQPHIASIQVDSADALAEVREFLNIFMPGLSDRLALYEGRRPIFDLYSVEDEINLALKRTVGLKSGGYLVIDQTEAMTTIDVNTGAYVGHSNQEETIFLTNVEAAAAVARQLRLRNLGGIIIIDFIDMQEEEHRSQVLEALEAALRDDHARTQIYAVSPLGLIEMTRKRTRDSLEHILCGDCPTCSGRGQIKSPETVCYEIFREILRQHCQFPDGELTILAHELVVEMLLDEESGSLAELEQLTGRTLRLQTQSMNGPDEFDVVPM